MEYFRYIKTGQYRNFTSKVINIISLKIKMTSAKLYSLTGFQNQKNLSFYKQCLNNLGWNYIEKLSDVTEVLVVNQTCTEKFKVAYLYNNPIFCVNKKWLEDSHKKNCIQPRDKYKLTQKDLFLGVNVAVCGFSAEKTKKIQKIIKQKNGIPITKYKAAHILRNTAQIPQQIDIILASEDEIQRAKYIKFISQQDQDITPLVGLEWLQDSLKRKRCKYPKDYAVNQIKTKPLIKSLGKINLKLTKFLQNDVMDKNGDFLQNLIIHIDKDMHSSIINVLKNLIAICGGYWTDKFTSMVTHVLVAQIDQPTYQYYRKYGSRTYVIRPQWLIDSVLLLTRVHQEDYQIRRFNKFKQQQMKTFIKQEILRINPNSQNFNSLPSQMRGRMTMGNSNTLPLTSFNNGKNKSVVVTQIFKGRQFYIDKRIKNEQIFIQLGNTIRNAGGRAYDQINSTMIVYVPLKDSPQNKQYCEQLISRRYKFLPVSIRWINQCVKKNTFIQPNLDQYFIYRPFNFNTPLPDFHKLTFDIIGFELFQMMRIKQLLPVLGSTRINPNKKDLTHVICGPKYKDQSIRINKIKAQNSKVEFIDSQWVFQCINNKKLISTQKYVISQLKIQNEVLHTPQKKSQNSSQSKNSDQKSIQTDTKTVAVKKQQFM